MVDRDAGFTKKNGESYFGYKMHVGVDEGSTLIREIDGTSADINDCLVFKGLSAATRNSFVPTRRMAAKNIASGCPKMALWIA